MNIYTKLIFVGTLSIGVFAYLFLEVANRYLAYTGALFSTFLCLTLTFFITKQWLDEKHGDEIENKRRQFDDILKGLKMGQETSTLEKTIREGTRTLIKNALDYFKLENIKNEMGASAALENLQLDKYGQIIELLVEFSLILPDLTGNQSIVQEEIDHQIKIYQTDERPFALFLQRIMEKYKMSLTIKRREKADQAVTATLKACPRCAESVLKEAPVCRHCGYDFKTAPRTSAHSTIAVDRLEEGNRLYRMGDYRKAVEMFTQAIELKKNYAGAYYSRAIAHYRLGNIGGCEKDLKEASYLGHKKARDLLKTGNI